MLQKYYGYELYITGKDNNIIIIRFKEKNIVKIENSEVEIRNLARATHYCTVYG